MFVVNCVGRSGGLILLWKEPFAVKVHSYTMGHIDCGVQHEENRWRFTGFYGHPETQHRHVSWALLRRLSRLSELQGLPWLVGGDFNEICYDSEKYGGNIRPPNQTRAFRDTLDDCLLQDLHGGGEIFTWVNRRSLSNIIFERLDRYTATLEWRLLYPVAQAQSLEFFHSDHRPILLVLGKMQALPVKRGHVLRFEPHWVTEPDCKEMVEKGWTKSESSISLKDRIMRCKTTLHQWAENRFKSLPRQLKIKRKKLENLKTQALWEQNVNQIGCLEKEVENLATKEEIYWKQRSRANWLAHGDRNSKYFHSCASIRRDRNFIHGLVSSHGDWCTTKSQMIEIIQSYFTKLFESNNSTEEDRRLITDCVEPKIDEHMNSILCAPFSATEIKRALFDMHPDKAPGSDNSK
ncbi:uncharacterized protein [Primulina huaijiensis]|uniref:uncharacterized protein n=1 Tax=Primulina huaijiensis TaxID=1492673 RepID=UPI003CC72B46